jgi:TrmH family RNA methyltransferase
MKSIRSSSNPKIALLRELQRRPGAYREHGVWLVEGLHLVREWLACGAARPPARMLLASEDLFDGAARPAAPAATAGSDSTRQVAAEVARRAAELCPEVYAVPHQVLDSAASGATEHHLLLLLEQVETEPDRMLGSQGLSVWLEALQDAGNVGTIIRTAASAGADYAVLGPGCAAAYSPKVVRAARGGHFWLPVLELADPQHWLQALERLGPRACATTLDPQAQELFDADLRQPCAWLFGNEGHGLSNEAQARCARSVRIAQRGPQSLNVASAAAVCLYENLRQMERARSSHSR